MEPMARIAQMVWDQTVRNKWYILGEQMFRQNGGIQKHLSLSPIFRQFSDPYICYDRH